MPDPKNTFAPGQEEIDYSTVPFIGQDDLDKVYMEADYSTVPDIGQLNKERNDQIVSQPEESFRGEFITYKGTDTDKLPTPVDNETYNETRDIEIQRAAEDPMNTLPPKNFTFEERAKFFDYKLLNTMKQSYDRIVQDEDPNYRENVNKKTAGEYLKEKGMTDEQLEEFGIYDPENERYTGKFGKLMGEEEYSEMNMFLMSNGIDPEKRDKTWEDRGFYNNTGLGRAMARGVNSDTSYFWGFIKSVNQSPGNTLRTLGGAEKLLTRGMDWGLRKVTGSEENILYTGHDNYWNQLADWSDKRIAEGLPDVPDNMLGGALQMLGHMAMFPVELYFTPATKLVLLSKYTGGVLNKIPKLAYHLGGTTAMRTYNETDNLGQSLVEGAKGFGDGVFLHMLGPISGRFGEMIGKTPIRQTFWAMGINSAGFGAKGATDELSRTGEWDWKRFGSDAMLGGMLAVPTLAKIADVYYTNTIMTNRVVARMSLDKKQVMKKYNELQDIINNPNSTPAEKAHAQTGLQGIQNAIATRYAMMDVAQNPEIHRKAILNDKTLSEQEKQIQLDKIDDTVRIWESMQKGEKDTVKKDLNTEPAKTETVKEKPESKQPEPTEKTQKKQDNLESVPKKETRGKDLVKEAGIEDVYESKDGNSYVFFHYGDVKGPAMDPKHKKQSYTRDQRVNSKLDYYVDPLQKEGMIKSNQLNSVEVSKEKVYPFNKDPLNFTEKITADLKKQNLEATPERLMDNMHKYANEAGYDMIIAEWNGRYRAESTKPLKYTANPEVSKITSRNKAVQISELEQQAKDLVRLSKGKAKGPWEGTLLQNGLREAMNKHGDKAPEEIKTKWEEIQNTKTGKEKNEPVIKNEKESQGEPTEKPNVVYTAQFVDKPEALTSEFKPRHKNVIAHHTTMEFKPADPKVEPGKKGKVKVIGRVSDGKADALLIEGVESSNKNPHITLSVSEGTKPFYSNQMIEKAFEATGGRPKTGEKKTEGGYEVEIYKKPKEIDVTEGYFNGKADVKAPLKSVEKETVKMKTPKDRAADKVAQGFDDLATAMGIIKKAEGAEKPDVLKAVKDIAEGIFELGVENVKDMISKMKTRVSERYDEKTAAELYKVFDDNIKTIEKVYSEASKKRAFAEKLLKDPDVSPEIKKGMSIDSKEYVPISNEVTMKDARLEIARSGVDEVFKMVQDKNNGMNPRVRVATALEVINEYNTRLKDKTLLEAERVAVEKDAVRLAEFMTQYGTELGQGVQAFHIWSKLNPVTMKKYMVDKIKENTGRELTEKELAEIDRLTKRVEEAYEGFDKQRAVTDLLKYQAQIEGVKWQDLAMSVWYANILSGFKTHELNFLANMANVAGELTTSTIHGLITGNPREGVEAFKGMLNGFARGLTEAGNTLATGEAPVKGVKVDLTTNPNKLSALEATNKLLLKPWRYPGRMLSAVDAMFFYGLKDMRARELYYLEAKKGDLKGKEITEYIDRKLGGETRRRLALEQAASEGFEGRDQRRRAAEILDSQLPERLNQDMNSYASRGTFNYSPEGTIGKMTDLITHVIEGFEVGSAKTKPLKFVIPFTRVLTNVANTYFDYSPYGFVRAARGSIGGKGSKDMKYRREYTPEERSKEYIKATMGTIAALSWLVLSQHEDENGEKLFEITANGTGDYKKNFNLTSRNGWMPYSVKIRVGGKDRWFSYKNTPLAIPLSLVGTYNDYRTYRSGEWEEKDFMQRFGMMTWSSVQYFSDLTFLRGTSEFLSAFSEGAQGQDKIARFFQNVAKGFVVPNLETQVSRQIQHWAQMPMKDAPVWHQKLYRDIPIARSGLNDMVNALGEPVIPDLSRWVNMDVEYSPIWDLIVKNEAWLTKPSRSTFTYNEEGELVKLDDDQYYQYAKRRGEIIKELIEKDLEKLQNMDKLQVQDRIKDYKDYATKKAKYELGLGEYSLNKNKK